MFNISTPMADLYSRMKDVTHYNERAAVCNKQNKSTNQRGAIGFTTFGF